MTDVPDVECVDCERRTACIRVSDGTVYRPFAWTFPDPRYPLHGFCPVCMAAAEAAIALR